VTIALGTVGPPDSSAARSPGRTTTETPRRPTAVWIATRRLCGICFGVTTSHQYEQSWKVRSGWVSWKKPIPISWDWMCEAMATTGAPLRWAS